jgi:hypothetical protein
MRHGFGHPLKHGSYSVLKDELQTNMRLLGVTSLDELNPTLVNSRNLELEIPDTVNAIGETRDQHLIRAKI